MTPSLAAFLAGAAMAITALVLTLSTYGDAGVPLDLRLRVAGLATAGLFLAVTGGLSYLL